MKKHFFITFFIIITLNFFLPRLMPGDPFTDMSVDNGEVVTNFSIEDIEKYRNYYGFDKPLVVQYKEYIVNIFKAELGYSLYFNEKVVDIIKSRLLWTLGISGFALFFSVILGILLALISIYNRNNRIDKFIYSILIIFNEIPSFLIALVFLFIFSVKLKISPLAGGKTAFMEYENNIEMIKDLIKYGFLPCLSLIFSNFGNYYLISRNSMLDIITKDYILTARAKGINRRLIYFRHILKNAILPILTRIFISVGSILGSAILVENVFKYPGIGTLIRQAILYRDYTLLQGILLITVLFVLVMNFLSEIIYKKIDPRLTK